VGDAVPYLKEEDKKYYEEFQRVCRFQEPGLIETEFKACCFKIFSQMLQ
jgi:para-nitrobenzyl esterase